MLSMPSDPGPTGSKMSAQDPQQRQRQQETEESWIITAVDKSPSLFFTTFSINNKRYAHRQYQQLINDSSALSPDVKNDLIVKFNRWKGDEGPQFRLDRQSRVSAIKAAARLVKGSEPFAGHSIERVAAKAAAKKGTGLSVETLSSLPSESSISANTRLGTPMGISTLSVQDEAADQIIHDDGAIQSALAVSGTTTAEAIVTTLRIDNSEKAADTLDINDNERAELLASIEQARHSVCDKASVDAFINKKIKKSGIADLMAITGVSVPSLPTTRMTEFFGRSMLEQLAEARVLPEPAVDDATVLKAVRQLPLKQDRRVSDEAFIVTYISPVLQGTLKADTHFALHFPNTMSEVQKTQGIKPDRPDVIIKARELEVLYGEVAGLNQETSDWKNKLNLSRLTRFGKAHLEQDHEIAPLLQVVYTNGASLRDWHYEPDCSSKGGFDGEKTCLVYAQV
ncbi:hypothetical protein BGW39_007278 [Mortierella sp. 14UC]|nr:hypothetical protein BGW39_007278 [Mortierella sp. 14UC]